VRRVYLLCVPLLLLTLNSCAGVAPAQSTPEGGLTSVRLAMGYRPDIQFAPLYVTQESGYFSQAGLSVEFNHMPENDAAQLVGINELQFAIVSGEQVLLARQQGLPIVYVAAWWQDNPVAVAAPVESGIEVAQDLAGKKVGLPGAYGASYIGLRALLSAAGIAESALTLDPIGYTQVESLIAGLDDAVVIYANNEPLQLRAQGMQVNVIRVADYIHLPSNGIITNEATMEENPQLVRAMVGAFLQGLADTIEDPDAAYEVSKKYVEGLADADQSIQRGILTESIAFWRAERLGFSDMQAWENIQQVLLEMGLLEKPLELSQVYTNEFLP
jgi:NitT/TauT family transport system substrate-binding protein